MPLASEGFDRLRYGRPRVRILCVALVLAMAAGCSGGSGQPTPGGGSAASDGLGAGPFPTLSPRAEDSGQSACSLPARVPTPDWVPTDLPWPPGSYVSRDLGTDGHRAEVVVPVSQQEFARFFRQRWPRAGYSLGEGDAEPGKELDQEFSGPSGQGSVKAEVVLCNPGYQLVFFTFAPS
jgi:hypothetical protein